MYVRKCICIYVTKPHFKSSNMPYPLSLIASPISYLVSGIAITHTHPHTHVPHTHTHTHHYAYVYAY